MEISIVELRFILTIIGDNEEIQNSMLMSGTSAQYVSNSLWYNSTSDLSNKDTLYNILIGAMMVCFPEYIVLTENRGLSDLHRYSLALCYLFPERVSNATLLDALTPIQKDYDVMFKEIMLAFHDKLGSLSKKYTPISYDITEHFGFFSLLIDDGILSEDKLKRCLDVLFHNFTFD